MLCQDAVRRLHQLGCMRHDCACRGQLAWHVRSLGERPHFIRTTLGPAHLPPLSPLANPGTLILYYRPPLGHSGWHAPGWIMIQVEGYTIQVYIVYGMELSLSLSPMANCTQCKSPCPPPPPSAWVPSPSPPPHLFG